MRQQVRVRSMGAVMLGALVMSLVAVPVPAVAAGLPSPAAATQRAQPPAPAAASAPAPSSCILCALNSTKANHGLLLLANGGGLRVDGDVYVNSSSGGTGPGCLLRDREVCGDAFDAFGAGGFISAGTISSVGGWQTHDDNDVTADSLAQVDGVDCLEHPNPPAQLQTANVCIHMPVIADPLDDPADPDHQVIPPPDAGPPVADQAGCPAGARIPTGTPTAPVRLNINSGIATLCPGSYYGGIMVRGSASVTMTPGTYYMAGGGFGVTKSGSVIGTSIMVYNTSGAPATVNTAPGADLIPASDATKATATSGEFGASPSVPTFGQVVTLTYEISVHSSAPLPTGAMTFFDGQDPIAACSDMALVAGSISGVVKATCTTSWAAPGTRSLTAVYFGDSVYNATGRTRTLSVTSPSGSALGPIDIETNGSVRLDGPTTGAYEGLTLFQDRSSAFTITIQPGAGSAPQCPADFSTATTPPAACGALGGIAGTIYAADPDALVRIVGEGLADLRVISGRIQIETANARFTGRRSSTAIACLPGWVVFGEDTACTATISDASSGGTPSDPTGQVTIAPISGPGATSPGSGTCTLVPDDDPTTFTSSCSVTYVPSGVATGLHSVAASYGGSSLHAASIDAEDALVTVQPAGSTVTVSCPASQTYTGLALTPCTAEATGVGMAPVDVTDRLEYGDNVDVGTATADAIWTGDPNHTGSGGSGSFAITAASPYPTTFAPLTTSPTSAATIDYELDFAFPVSGLSSSSFIVSGDASTGATACVVTPSAGSGATFVVGVSGCVDGSLRLTLHAYAVADRGVPGPPTEVTASSDVIVDRTAPAVGTPVIAPSTVGPGGSFAVTAVAWDPSGIGTAYLRIDGGSAVAMSIGGTSTATLSATTAAPIGLGAHSVCVTAIDALGSASAGFACSTITVVASPTIASFSPPKGGVGTSVTITGTAFTGASSVRFNGLAAPFTVVSASTIVTSVPAGASNGKLTVTTPGGSAISVKAFSVEPKAVAPKVSAYAPKSAPVGTLVTITGTNLAGVTGVTFNGVAASTILVFSATELRVTVPVGATTGPVRVVTAGGTGTGPKFTVTP